MGCCGSTPQHRIIDKTAWIGIYVDSAGNVTDAQKKPLATGNMNEKGMIARIKKGQTGGSWEEQGVEVAYMGGKVQKVGGKVTYDNETPSGWDKLVGGFAQGTLDSAANAVTGCSAAMFFTPDIEPEDRVTGKADWNGKKFLVGGEKDEHVLIVDEASQTPVLHCVLSSTVRKQFYDHYISKDLFKTRASGKPKAGSTGEANEADNALCAQEDEDKTGISGPTFFWVRPDFVEKYPLSLLSLCVVFGVSKLSDSVAGTAGYLASPDEGDIL